MNRRQLPIILALGTTQTLAWASSYYLPAILADPIARDLGVSSNWIFSAFSASLVISALIGPRVGRQIDLVGGRSVLSMSNLVLAAGLVLLGFATSIPLLVIAWLLLGVGMGAGLYDAALAAHLPRLMEAAGATAGQAVFAGALIGPAQVAARIFEASFLSRYHPLVSTRLACVTHPIGAAILALAGGGAASVFAIFHGTGNGILTIARGTLPLAIFGPLNYGYRLGIIGAPARMAQAAAPLAFGLLIDVMGSRVLIVSSALSLSALLALFLLRKEPAER